MNFKILKFIGIFITIIFLNFLSITNTKAQTFSGGGGQSITDPYLISNIDDINELTALVNSAVVPLQNNWSYGKFFKVTQDITDTVRVPIGESFLYILNIILCRGKSI